MKDNIHETFQNLFDKPGVFLPNSKYYCQNCENFNNESKNQDSATIKFSICITDSNIKKKSEMLKSSRTKSVKDTDYVATRPKTSSQGVKIDKGAKLTIVNELKYKKKFSLSQNKVIMTPIEQGENSVRKVEEDPESMCFVNSGDEINLLQKYMQKVTKEMQHLLNKIAPNLGEICADGISIVLTADVKNVTIANPVQYEPENYLVTVERPFSYDSQSSTSPATDIIPYYTPIKQQIQISVKKFDTLSDNFFKVLSVIYAVFQLIGSSTCNVPGLYIRNWHFRNMAQGFLLRIFLKKAHVNTLNIMRNLYFVIITTDTPNLAIEINVDLKKGIFSLYDASLSPLRDYELIEWTDMHEDIFEKNTISTDGAVVKFDYNTDCFKYQSLKKEGNVHNLNWVHNLDSESVFTSLTRRSSFIITETKSIATSLDNIINQRLRSIQAYTTVATSCSAVDVGNNICNVFSPKYWAAKVFSFLRMIKDFNTNLGNCDFIDESIFERTSVDTNEYLKDVMTTQNSNIVLKCLAHSFGCAVFSFLLSVF